MSKSFIPYHLRQNKAIDRNLFVELLHMINRYSDFLVKKYEYVSMGGPFLEDFKVIHAGTGIHKMISFEIDSNTYIRQKFNKPLSCIKLRNESSTNFILNYDFIKPCVVWLDFTTPSKLSTDLNDVYELVAKLKRGDILKITLNANAASIPCGDVTTEIEKPIRRFEYLEDSLGDYLPEDAGPNMITGTGYPVLLYRILELAIDRGMGAATNVYFQPLTSFLYADGQTMLTFTGIILNREETKPFFKTTGIKEWDLNCVRNNKPISISVPDLSVKERIFLDTLLPNSSAAVIHRRLKYLVAEKEKMSLEGIENYVRYYKQFPYFSKIVF